MSAQIPKAFGPLSTSGEEVTIFSRMTALARQHDAINLAQGFPDFNPHPDLLELLREVSTRAAHQYAPMPGSLALRQATSTMRTLHGVPAPDPETEVTITNGATQALFTALSVLVEPGDEVLIFSPAYDCYAPAIEQAGGRVRWVPLDAPEFRPDWQRVREAITPTTRGVVINSPHNPTASVLTHADMEQLATLCEEYNLWVVSDEAYEHMVFDPQSHVSPHHHPALRQRSIVCGSFGKTLHATGWKVGYALAPADFTRRFRKLHQYTVFAVNSLAQEAIARYLVGYQPELEVADLYAEKRDQLGEALGSSPYRLLPCNGTYFQLVDYSALCNWPDTQLALWLTEHAGVATVPFSALAPDYPETRLLRLCFAKQYETLQEAARRLLNTLPQ